MLIEKLISIQTALKAPKGQFNKFGNYNYRSCEDILEALKPLLKEHKCAITISDDLVNGGSRYHIKATVTLWDAEGADKIEVSAFAREEETKKGMDGSQITGSSSSYARKYALNGMFCIDDTKDSDGTNDHGKSAPAPSPVICPQCNNPVKPVKKNGVAYSAAEAFEKMGMCADCWKMSQSA